ncbi:MAG: N-formylglutamate amidohydrolase, partial [Gammaproteobacteria bacterium]
MSDAVFVLEEGDGPIVATAIHAGHALHPEIAALIALDEATRLREEDPFTAQLARVAPTRLIALRSRFEVDLNRPRERAVYRVPA